MKKVDTKPYLGSLSLNDNLFGLLGKTADSRQELVRILRKIAKLRSTARQDALRNLLVISGMRGLMGKCR